MNILYTYGCRQAQESTQIIGDEELRRRRWHGRGLETAASRTRTPAHGIIDDLQGQDMATCILADVRHSVCEIRPWRIVGKIQMGARDRHGEMRSSLRPNHNEANAI